MRKYLKTSAIILSACILAGCASEQKTDNNKTEQTTMQSKIAASESEGDNYDSDILSEDIESEKEDEDIDEVKLIDYQKYLNILNVISKKNENAVYSPVSLNSCLDVYSHMIEKNNVYDEIRNFTSGFDYINYKSLDSDGVSKYSLINRIWANKDKNLNFDNCDVPKSFIETIDMSDSESATKMKNDFVAEKTDGFIKSTPSILNDQTYVDVMNVAYFSDCWLDGEANVCEDAKTFNNYDGTSSDVTMIGLDNSYYYENDTCYVVPIKYYSGMSFSAVYPKKSIDDIIIDGIFDEKNMVNASADIKIPEFESDSEYTINDYVDQLGLSHLKDAKNLFTDEKVAGDIMQVAKIKVNRKGTEAAAVTEMVLNGACAPSGSPIDLTFDKPFIYMIRDCNNDIAFIGKVTTFNK
ncbi:MAG: hypothetical protein IKN54_00515 [Lachnospiraceae bacterium]|nr:hypothetical protein [Lachnospiraceae bacterium]